MLKTIHTIGEEISKGRDVWRDIIETKIKVKSKKDDELLTLNIILDLDEREVIVSDNHYQKFDDDFETLKDLRFIATQGGNFKAVYVCVDATNIDKLAKTLFGKPDKNTGDYPTSGELMQSIEKDLPTLVESEFYSLLAEIVTLRESFFEKFFDAEKQKFNLIKINEGLNLSSNSKLVLLYVSIQSEKYKLNGVPLAKIEEYNQFIKSKFFKNEEKQKNSAVEKLCYVTGCIETNTNMAEFSGANRYNLNRMFILDKINYSSDFGGKKSYHKNYQLSQNAITLLERGSDYILENLTTTIADVPHALIPEFLNSNKITRDKLKSILSSTDLLFNSRKFEELNTYLEMRTDDDVYWLNFLAIDSNGNYFKAGNIIKDVSKLHFITLIKTLDECGKIFSAWLGKNYSFNLNVMYRLVPVRKDKENVNQALKLFAAVLEQRKIDIEKLYAHFTELVLCHWYERYRSFTNVRSMYKDFDFAVKDAVFGYMAFIYSLKKLNLIKRSSYMNTDKPISDIAKDLENFFKELEYSSSQVALFYLGRALSQAGRAQQKKGNKKTVLNKINFNGMDKRSVLRLSTDLFEKGTQYNSEDGKTPLIEKMQWNLAEFNRRFEINTWHMNPQEALFFLLSGYTYGIKTKTSNNETLIETETTNQ